MYDLKLEVPLGIAVARLGPTDVKWLFYINLTHFIGFCEGVNSLSEKLLVNLRYVNSLTDLHIPFGSPMFCSSYEL